MRQDLHDPSRSTQVGAGDPPILLSILANTQAGQGQQAALAEQLLRPVTQRYEVTFAPAADTTHVQEQLKSYVHQTDGLLLIPFGLGATRCLQSSIEPIRRALGDATGEGVSLTQLPAPYAVPARPLFAPLEGLCRPATAARSTRQAVSRLAEPLPSPRGRIEADHLPLWTGL